MPDFAIVIPARFASSRFPGKPLALLRGRPVLRWVWERARDSAAAQVLIATDDERIAAVARGFGADVVMTDANHASGTDRIAEVAQLLRWPGEQLIVNLQGDEPSMPAPLIDLVASTSIQHPAADIATACCRFSSVAEWHNPNAVKVVGAADGRALYFSRAPIPAAVSGDTLPSLARRHIGIYAYRVAALRRLARLGPCDLEREERLEQLRALHAGMTIMLAETDKPPLGDVNTQADLARLELLPDF